MFEFSRVFVALLNADGPDRKIDGLIACSVAARYPSSLIDMKEHEQRYGLEEVCEAVANDHTMIGQQIPRYTESLEEVKKLADELLPEFYISFRKDTIGNNGAKVEVKWAENGGWKAISQIGDCLTMELSALQALFLCIRYLEFKKRVKFHYNHWTLLTD